MTGTLSSDSLDLKAITGRPHLGPVAFTAGFNMLTKKRKPGQKRVKGQLPVGNISGTVLRASYGIMKFADIDFSINTTKDSAMGHIEADRKLLDLSVDFSFKGADVKHTLKIKPHVRFHKRHKKDK